VDLILNECLQYTLAFSLAQASGKTDLHEWRNSIKKTLFLPLLML
jgi:hypothetical protein